MSFFIKGVIAAIAAIVVMCKADSSYEKRLDRNPKWIKLFILIQTVLLLLVYFAAFVIIGLFVPEDYLDKLFDRLFGMYGIQFLLQLKKFVFCKRDVMIRKLAPLVNEYKQVGKCGHRRLGTSIKEKDLDSMKRHIKYILGHIEAEVPSMKEHALEIVLGKSKRKYYVGIKYNRNGDVREALEVTREEFKQCMKRMQMSYEVKCESGKDLERAEIRFRK